MQKIFATKEWSREEKKFFSIGSRLHLHTGHRYVYQSVCIERGKIVYRLNLINFEKNYNVTRMSSIIFSHQNIMYLS